MERQEVYKAINSERNYQDQLWNESTTETEGKHSVTEWFVYAQNYCSEALHILSRKPDPEATEEAKHILRKVGAIMVAAMEEHGVELREFPTSEEIIKRLGRD